MSSREWLFRLDDILDALARIHEYTLNLNLQLFELDQRTIDAVVRNLEIIGEAARHVPESIVQEYISYSLEIHAGYEKHSYS